MTDGRDLLDALETLGIRDKRVRGAFASVPREYFVPPASRGRAYEDVPLPIPHGLVTTQPSLIARMVEALELRGDERVLEIGTGFGFQTALLADLADEVWSVERHSDLAEAARSNLDRVGVLNARVVIADGTVGLPERAPFDAIVVAAAFPRVPAPLAQQLAASGRLVQPIGPGGSEEVALFREHRGGVRRAAMLTGANFVRLVGAHGFREA
ncbi:MAG: protein-L-isoaspartate(D-aspartate) O-methyltransferase [Myxococcales bacterium]|nr:protein-L-isoaspartate(D-aspartate) O-methyltransferase [Myxococcales bacterium]